MSYCAPETHVELAALIKRIALELVAARDHLHNVELALDQGPCPTVQSETAADSASPAYPLSHIARLQSLDLVMQLLAELAACLDRLSHEPALTEAGLVDVHDVVRGLHLADLQRRLSAASGTALVETRVELF